MHTLDRLIDPHEPGWPLVQSWIDAATNPIEILPPDPSRRGSVLHSLQITNRSSMGAIAYETGGLLVDRGWIRILGGAGPRMAGTLSTWNGLGARPVCAPISGLSVIAHDAAGGVFALDRGALGPGGNGTWYLCPDTLEWIALHRGYSHFLQWICTGDVAGFAGKLRWEGWAADVASAGPDRAFAASPERWTAEGKHTKRANLRSVAMPPLFALELETGARLRAERTPDRAHRSTPGRATSRP